MKTTQKKKTQVIFAWEIVAQVKYNAQMKLKNKICLWGDWSCIPDFT